MKGSGVESMHMRQSADTDARKDVLSVESSMP